MTISDSSRVWSPEEIDQECLRSLLTAITTFQLLDDAFELVLLTEQVGRDVVLKDDELVHFGIRAQPDPIPQLIAPECVPVHHRSSRCDQLGQVVGIKASRVEPEIQVRTPQELSG